MSPKRESSTKRRWKIASRTVAVIGFMVVALTGWILLKSGMQIPALPRPNGYDDFKRAGAMIVGSKPGPSRDEWKASEAELRAFVMANQKALAIGRAGLTKKCQVPLSAARGTLDQQIADHIQWSSNIRKFARLLVCEARLAGIEGRRDDALRAELELIRLGPEAGRGGMLIDCMVGQAITGLGLALLRDNRAELTTAESRFVIRSLEASVESREPIATVIARERKFGKSAGVWQVRALATLTSAFESQLTPAFNLFEFSENRTLAESQLLIADLGLQIYRQEHEGAPDSLEELVPNLLARVPFDPFQADERPLIYRRETTGTSLYSVGPDGRDDGGKPILQLEQKAQGDISLSTW